MTQSDPFHHHRRSIRLSGWDYRAPGYYFVTICTYKREHLFSHPAFHDIAVHTLIRIPQQPHAQYVKVDVWVVMPNHVHIIFLFTQRPFPDPPSNQPSPKHLTAGSLGVVVGQYKTAVTTPINQLRQEKGTAVWQRGYYERIIRNEQELQATRQYIHDNPIRWAEDRDNLDKLLNKMTHHPS